MAFATIDTPEYLERPKAAGTMDRASALFDAPTFDRVIAPSEKATIRKTIGVFLTRSGLLHAPLAFIR